MLRVHPEFRIYDIGFAETIKSLVAEGFIKDIDVTELAIDCVCWVGNDDQGNHMCEDVENITADTVDALDITYNTLYNRRAKEAYRLVTTVCEVFNGELIPAGIIYL